MDILVKLGESRQTSASRRNEIEFQRVIEQTRIDRTETSFAGKSKMTTKDLKEATKRRREIADQY